MKTMIIYSLAVAGLLSVGSVARADHDKNCKGVHGKVTVVTENGVTVNDKMYKVSDSTRITRDGKEVKLAKITAGDVVCVDTRGESEIGDAGVAAVTVLDARDGVTIREKEFVREKEKEKIREEK